MWNYTDKVKEHFFNPKNAGALDEANAVGEVGSITCGDALKLMMKVNPDSQVIEDAKFQTFGCGSAIASSSALTEMIIGKTVDEALAVTNRDIAEYLGGLPPEKMHCSVMGAEALRAAIANFKGEEWVDDHEEGELVCKCFGIDAAMIERAVTVNSLTTLEEVTHYTKAGGSCQTCHEKIEEVLEAVLAKTGALAPPKSHAPGTVGLDAIKPLAPKAEAAPAKLTNVQRMQKIMFAIEELRPQIQRDGGDVELVDIDGKDIYVRLTGACSGCSQSAGTMMGVQAKLVEALGEFVRVKPASLLPVGA
ncbi:Fe-S cluster assembly protein NifU [Azospirillum brasilense]|uniref:Nitrogen fixation protein NifU n=2 Tax=Azospirillum TaxID=191 RepID=A0A560C165_AZOBR|nr:MULTISPECIES: Fe-S cluster assembly protein NifU [Azospirillum]MBK3737280.1 Fe-S cluster assembly protein NifU [Azospirillum brasilense]MBK3803136.1 Fe-S cluster assembly protein NifU [Azospirillum argentinense]NUB04810.1 Fe-S cluster assembly protein NifU [Azospirillum baldaniorum]QCN96202.1 Fe-S cluster assembly protein NifU [Azospirillum argentinense]TWA60535.1 modular FeS cluster scaffolding protein NifU [Azospirillum baldaniorum]